MPKKSDTTPAERAALTARVEAGEWLRINDAAKVLGISRTKTDTLIRRGLIGHRLEPGSTYRQLNPKDLTRLLAEAQRERRGPGGTAPNTQERKFPADAEGVRPAKHQVEPSFSAGTADSA